MIVWFEELVMRKKFLILWGMSLEPFGCLEELDMPEKLRFSLWGVEVWDEELKSCVILRGGLSQYDSPEATEGIETRRRRVVSLVIDFCCLEEECKSMLPVRPHEDERKRKPSHEEVRIVGGIAGELDQEVTEVQVVRPMLDREYGVVLQSVEYEACGDTLVHRLRLLSNSLHFWQGFGRSGVPWRFFRISMRHNRPQETNVFIIYQLQSLQCLFQTS